MAIRHTRARPGPSRSSEAGLSFVELIIVLSIFGALSAVVLFNFSDFSSSVSLNNLTQDIALVIKRAQTEASSGRFFGATGATTPSYGVFFDGSDGSSFIYFEDTGSVSTKNKLFDPSEEREEIAIETADRISGLCVKLTPSSSCASVERLHLTFIRPYLDATIVSISPNHSSAAGSPIEEARITVVSSKGKTRQVVVTPIGQIRVE